MTKKYKILLVLGIAIVSYAFGRYVQPAEVVTKEVEVVKRDVKTIIKTIKQPDGTIIRERTTEDKTQTSKSNESIVKAATSKWHVSVLVGRSFENNKDITGISIQKDVLGPISVGIWGLSNNTIGVSLGISF